MNKVNTGSGAVPIIEPPIFSNWGDLWFPKIANKLVPFFTNINWIRPNHITLTSFFMYLLGSLLLFIPLQYNLLFSAILLPLSYVLDCLDGQLARATQRGSQLGDYLEKVLDVFKIFIITLSLAIASYLKTNDIFYIFLGFTACFFFNFRYYIKLETMFSSINKDKDYLIKSRELRWKLYDIYGKKYKKASQTLMGKLYIFFHKNRAIVFVDEAEFVIFTSVVSILNKIEIALWVFAISQILISCLRFFERGAQLNSNSKNLLLPMRK
jgi:phosphatidylglycerophosphate synthase